MATGGRENVGEGERLSFKDRGRWAGFIQLRVNGPYGPSFSFWPLWLEPTWACPPPRRPPIGSLLMRALWLRAEL